MSASFKVFPGKRVYIKISLTPERAFYLLIPVDDQCCHFYTLDGQWIIHQPLRIPGLDLKTHQILPGDGYKGCIMFIIYFHFVLQHISEKSEAVLQEVVKKVFMDPRMIETRILQGRHHTVYGRRSCGESKRAC